MAEAGWLFRVASARKWGGGHVARCRALAEALRQDRQVSFALDSDEGGWRETLEQDGYRVLSGDWAKGDWCGSVVDGYEIPKDETRTLARCAPPLVAIDDLMNPPEAADLVIGLGNEDAVYPGPALQGPEYALIDKRFRDLPSRTIEESVEEVVITFGRHDALDATGLAISAMASIDHEGFRPRLTVILGSTSPNMEAVRRSLESWGLGARLVVDSQDMFGLLWSADLVVGAGGVSLYERMACGTPSVTVQLTDNQAPNIATAQHHGATLSLGPVENITKENLADASLRLALSTSDRTAQSRSGQRCVDGKGPLRVAHRMMQLAKPRESMPTQVK